jgi:hypothetical protein
MTSSQSKSLFRSLDFAALLVLVVLAVLFLPKFGYYLLTIALFTACGIPAARKLNPGADWVEQITVGLTIGLMVSALIVYLLAMAFNVLVNRYTVLGALAALALVGLISSRCSKD